MTGLERNSDLVEMASYALLLANTAYVNWSPDAIWFDNASSYGTPSYYVQRLFGEEHGRHGGADHARGRPPPRRPTSAAASASPPGAPRPPMTTSR